MQQLSRGQFVMVVAVVAFLAAGLGTYGVLRYSGGVLGLHSALSLTQGLPKASTEILPQDELVTKVVQETSPAVVSIIATKDVPIIEQYYTSPFPNDPFFQQFFGNQFQIPQYRQKGTQKQDVSSGTGFIVSPDGLILTNKHVVADTAADYTVLMNDGSKVPAKVLARDPVEDLAIVKIDKTGLPTLTLGDSSKIKIGQTAIAIGNSLGEFRNTVSVGVISGLERNITASGGVIGTEELSELIQTDAAINPGNSGGPLLNLEGEVVGINTAIVQGAQNIGFAIPINKAKGDIASVKASGRIVRPYLGVRYIAVNADVAKQNNLPVTNGAWLKSGSGGVAVVAGSPADKAGLQEGDIIIAVNGTTITQDQSLVSLIQQYSVGDTINVTYLRGGKQLSTSLKLTERPSSP